MRILITGGAGFLGSNLVVHYLSKGHDVAVIDNYATSKPENLPKHPKLLSIEGTIVNKKILDELFDNFNPTHVIHSAAAYKDLNNWEEDVLTNILGTINVIRASIRHKVMRFVNFQTALIYGEPKSSFVDESQSLQPITSYSISKASGEQFLSLSKLSFISLRMSTIYGPNHFNGPMPTFYKRISEGKKCFCTNTRRNFVDLRDFIELMDKILQNNNVIGFYNMASDKDYSIKQIFDLVLKNIGVKIDYEVPIIEPNADDISSFRLDPKKIKKDFNWSCKISLEDGVRDLVSWYKENGVENIFSHLTVIQNYNED